MGGGGVKNYQKLRDIIYGRPLMFFSDFDILAFVTEILLKNASYCNSLKIISNKGIIVSTLVSQFKTVKLSQYKAVFYNV